MAVNTMSTNMAVHFSSETDEWPTPQDFFDRLNEEFHFELDVCATHENAKCPRYFTRRENGLLQQWTGVCWMNPPYGREIGQWVKKAYESALGGATVVCLLPSRTDTAWWHDYCMKGEIRFVRGRLKFGDASENAPFPSAVVVFRPGVPETNRQLTLF
jgi:phage N-6-adenine-methyltransferase